MEFKFSWPDNELSVPLKAQPFFQPDIQTPSNIQGMYHIRQHVSFFRPKNSESPTSAMSAFFPILFLLLSSIPFSHEKKTAYEVLEKYNFPVGLLPTGVEGYDLDKSTGKFSVYLDGSCSFKVDKYRLKYKSTVTGTITTDKLSNLSGITVKVWIFWLKIHKITRVGDKLKFAVGIGSEEFPVSRFDESPTCGCGFDCENVGGRKIKPEFLVSSS